jgi:drug/metabolite transporter (DMT)-like permease
VTTLRWIGILLIAIGVGFVATGPELTRSQSRQPENLAELEMAASEEKR